MQILFKQLANEALGKVAKLVEDNCDPYGYYTAEAVGEFAEVTEDFCLERYTAEAAHNCGAEVSVIVKNAAGETVYSEEY